MRTRTWCLAAAVICAPVSRIAAQNDAASAGYVALIMTPTGGVSPVIKPWMLTDPSTRVGLETQWGHVFGNGGSLNSFTIGAILPFASGRGDVGLSSGYLKASCDVGNCSGFFLASAAVEGRVIQSSIGHGTFTLGLSGRVGFSKPSGATVWSASASVPFSIALGNRAGLQVVPFVSPGLGWGSINEGGSSTSGERFLLGGGIGVVSSKSGVGLTVGVQKIFISGGRTVFGAGFTVSPR